MKANSTFFQSIAAKYGVSEAHLLLCWGVQNGYAVLPKSLNPDRMRQNIDLFAFAIDDVDLAQMAAMDRGDSLACTSGDPSK
jgi:2,5-diketo-D-gluconate reductase A